MPSTDHIWSTYLRRGEAPRWLPARVAEGFASAHAAGRAYGGSPSTLRIDEEAMAPIEGELGRDECPPTDLVRCLRELLELAAGHPKISRHVFQQTALLWRAYMENVGLSPRSAFESGLVGDIVSSIDLQSDPGSTLVHRLKQLASQGKLPTLHDLIDHVYFAIRASQRRR